MNLPSGAAANAEALMLEIVPVKPKAGAEEIARGDPQVPDAH